MSNKNRIWYGTAEACEYLGMHRETLAKLRKEQLEKGKHWKVKNPQARRLTYLYKVSAIDEMQADVITEVPKNEPLNR
ncbi:MAG: hypothetical protein AAFY54_04650 [Cyanobacteria bacterium J06648_10]